MTTTKIDKNDLKEFKNFFLLKYYLNQFEFCTYKKRTMKGNFEIVDESKIEWNKDATFLLRFEDYLRKCCSISVVDDYILIDQYALRLK
jgi:hypothetical protein